MKDLEDARILAFALAAIVILSSSVCAFQIFYETRWGGSGFDVGRKVLAFYPTYAWVLGETASYGLGGSDVVVLMVNKSNGKVLKVATLGGPYDDYFRDADDYAGYIYVLMKHYTSTSSYVVLVKLDKRLGTLPGETVIWAKRLPYRDLYLVRSSSDGVYLAGGEHVIKLDHSGNVVWALNITGMSVGQFMSDMELFGDYIYIADGDKVYVVARDGGLVKYFYIRADKIDVGGDRRVYVSYYDASAGASVIRALYHDVTGHRMYVNWTIVVDSLEIADIEYRYYGAVGGLYVIGHGIRTSKYAVVPNAAASDMVLMVIDEFTSRGISGMPRVRDLAVFGSAYTDINPSLDMGQGLVYVTGTFPRTDIRVKSKRVTMHYIPPIRGYMIGYTATAKRDSPTLVKMTDIGVSHPSPTSQGAGYEVIMLRFDHAPTRYNLSSFPIPFNMDWAAKTTFVVGSTEMHGPYNFRAWTVDTLAGMLIASSLHADYSFVEAKEDLDVVTSSYQIDWSKIDTDTVIAVGGPLVNTFVYALNPPNRLGYGGLPFHWDSHERGIRDNRTGVVYKSNVGVVAFLRVWYVISRPGQPPIISFKYVLLVWGKNADDTLAMSIWLTTKYEELPSAYAAIVTWSDSNGNGRPDFDDTFTVRATW